jgi:hypothetical protein
MLRRCLICTDLFRKRHGTTGLFCPTCAKLKPPPPVLPPLQIKSVKDTGLSLMLVWNSKPFTRKNAAFCEVL